MKKGYKLCPFCANEIKEWAIKCQYCEEFLNKDYKNHNTIEEIPQKKKRIGTKVSLTIFVSSLTLWLLLLVFAFATSFWDDLWRYWSTVLWILWCILWFSVVASLLSFIICLIWWK